MAETLHYGNIIIAISLFIDTIKKVLKTIFRTLGIIHNKMTLGLDGRLWILPRTTRKHNVRFWILVN